MATLNKFPYSIRWAFNFKNWHPTEEEWSQAIMQVQEEERVRIGKFRYRDDAKASLVGRLMIRQWSKRFLNAIGSSQAEPTLMRTERRRPKLILSATEQELAKSTHFDFNVAHAGELTILGAEVSKTSPVIIGVDVMPFDRSRRADLEEFLRLMKRQFTNEEWNQIRTTSENCDQRDNEIMKHFYRFWCLKESFVKAEGSGLAWDLQRLSFNCPSTDLSKSAALTDTVLKVDGVPLHDWQFQEHLLKPDHCVAVAVKYNEIYNRTVTKNCEPFQFLSLIDLLGADVRLNSDNACTQARHVEWKKFLEKQIVKPF